MPYYNKFFCKKMDISINVSKETNDIKYISQFIQKKCECNHCYQLRKKYNKIGMIYNHYSATKPDINSKYGSILDHNSTIYLNNNTDPIAESLHRSDYIQQLLLSPHHDYYMNKYYHIHNIIND